MAKAVTTKSNSATQGIASWYRLLFGNTSVLFLLLIGFIAGLLWFAALRFFLVQAEETHYHANFAVYIDGVQQDFSDTSYYEEVAACTIAYKDEPKGRVHMHDKVNDVIHVHDKRVTYADFFHNIFWTVGDEVLETREAVYQNGGEKKLVFILNGQEVDRIDSRVIGNLDKLLVSFGDAATDFMAQYSTVDDTAAEVNKYQDPATCSGLNGPGNNSVMNRLKRAIAQ